MNFSSPIWVKCIIRKIVPIRAFAAVFELVMRILGANEDEK